MKLLQNNWESPSSEARLSTVFANRNQQYGAYVLRKEYDQTIIRSFAITLLAGLTLACIPMMRSYFFPSTLTNVLPNKEIVVEMTTPEEPIKQEEIKKEEQPSNQNSPNTIKDAIPVVVNRNTNDTIKTQDELLKTNTGLTTTKNDSVSHNPITTTGTENKENNNTNFVFHGWVEVMPSFPGGEMEMMKYLSKNLKYPERAKDAEAQGTVLISFIVDKEGNISNASVKKGIGFGCEEEAIRVIQNMPVWSPGKMNGKNVNVEYVLPVRFTLR